MQRIVAHHSSNTCCNPAKPSSSKKLASRSLGRHAVLPLLRPFLQRLARAQPVLLQPHRGLCLCSMAPNHAAHEPAPASRQLLSVAPMMDWTDVHYRQLARIISKRTWLWTEMVVDKTIIHTPVLDRFLAFPPEQHPIVCQLGGSDPQTLAAATRKVAEYGYDEINLNCGCPSDRVAGAGCFGASLMLQPELVAACMKAMAEASNGIPVTVKCRLGVDDVDSYEQLQQFVRVVSQGSPVRHFVVHARKCFLKGLNPHQNRTVPPLRHEWVYSLKRDFPHLDFSLNGGVQNCHEAKSAILYEGPWPTAGHVAGWEQPQHQQQGQQGQGAPHSGNQATQGAHGNGVGCSGAEAVSAPTTGNGSCCADEGDVMQRQQERIENGAGASTSCAEAEPLPGYVPIRGGILEGVMIGRAAYNDPWGCLGDADRAVFGERENAARNRREVLERYIQYADSVVGKYSVREDGHKDPNVRGLIKPLLGLFHGAPGCKRWKAAMDGVLKQDPPTVAAALAATLHLIPDAVLDAAPHTSDTLARLSFGQLATPQDRAGLNQTLTALKRAAAAQEGGGPHSKRTVEPRQQQTQQQQQQSVPAGTAFVGALPVVPLQEPLPV